MPLKQSDGKMSRRLFNLALKADPKSAGEVYMVWGLGLFMDEKYAEAAAVLQRGIDEKALPDDKPELYYYLAGALEMEGKTDEALAAAKVAAEKEPKNPTYAERVAWVSYHAKKYDEAAESVSESAGRRSTRIIRPRALGMRCARRGGHCRIYAR